MDKTRILVVDDDVAISKLLCTNFKARGYEVLLANNGKEALEAIESDYVDLIILDIMMPHIDGVEVCRQIREWNQVPIIMLSARGDEMDKVKCLELGADDYLTKPFGMAELMARVKTALRHYDASRAEPTASNYACGEMEINFAKREVVMAGEQVKLTPTEYSVLQHLVTNSNKVLTHSMLLQRVWGEEYDSEREYLRVFIGRLRKKLAVGAGAHQYIITDAGVGYHFAPPSN
jgi:two-component system, OmpR family, KDP operon response regulator KdpE